MLIICSECGKEYSDQAKSCPHCGAITAQNRYISYNMKGNNNYSQKNEKWMPYFKRKDSVYQKHPILAWTITIIGIVVGVYGLYSGIAEVRKATAYNAGYESVYKKY